MTDSFVSMFVTGAIALWLMFTVTWLVQLKTKNAAIVDAVWSASFPLLAAIYFILAEGFLLRKVLILAMAVAWGVRLASYLFFRAINHPEDVRYTALREQWGASQNLLMLRFFYLQALLSLGLSLPFALAMHNPSSTIGLIEWAGVALWVIALVGESVADAQLKRFKSKPANKGRICQTGLWNYSRHPNYFFEWLIWVSFFLFALGSPWGWMAILCPAAILFFLLKVTGIPYTEKQMIKLRGQAFIDYQMTTSGFVPLPKRKLKN